MDVFSLQMALYIAGNGCDATISQPNKGEKNHQSVSNQMMTQEQSRS